MKVIIAGCGRVGSRLALRFDGEGHDVSVIDRNQAALLQLSAEFKGQRIRGAVFDRDALLKAGIDMCDAFIAVTSGDNSNVVAATIAKKIYNVPQVLARIFDPRRADIYRRLGIPTISSVAWAANEMFSLVTQSTLTRDVTLGNGEVSLVRFAVHPDLAGSRLSGLGVSGKVRPVAVIRDGQAFLPGPEELIEVDDIVELAVLTEALSKLDSFTRRLGEPCTQ